MSLEQNWEESQPLIRELLGIHSFAIWVQQMTPIAFGVDRICFRVPNQHFADFIEKNIEPQILELFAARYNLSIFLDFTTDGEHILGSQNLKITENYRLNNDQQIEDSSRSIERVEPAEISNAATEESSTSSNQATQSAQTRWTRPLTNESLVSRDFISERRVISGIPENKTFNNFG